MPNCFSHLVTLEVRGWLSCFTIVAVTRLWYFPRLVWEPTWTALFKFPLQALLLLEVILCIPTRLGTLPSRHFILKAVLSDTDDSYINWCGDVCGCCTWPRGRDPGLEWEAIFQGKVSQAASSKVLPMTLERWCSLSFRQIVIFLSQDHQT